MKPSGIRDYDDPRLQQAARTHHAIKAWYFQHGGSEEGWQKITYNPRLFNKCWRKYDQWRDQHAQH